MRLAMIFCAGLASGALFVAAQQTSVSEVHQLHLEDQKDRGVGGQALRWDQTEPRDLARRTRPHQLLASGQLKSAEDFHYAAFIYQHGQSAEDYLVAHILATVAVRKGDAKSLWISAARPDRYLRKIGQPQIFGSQYENQGDSPYTQEAYNRDLIPDSFRAVFCVPGIEQQKKNVAAFDAGKYPEGILPPGCTR